MMANLTKANVYGDYFRLHNPRYHYVYKAVRHGDDRGYVDDHQRNDQQHAHGESQLLVLIELLKR